MPKIKNKFLDVLILIVSLVSPESLKEILYLKFNFPNLLDFGDFLLLVLGSTQI